MKVVKERDRIRSVIARWEAQFADLAEAAGLEESPTLKKLRALDLETASADDVASIIGNRSWTTEACGNCRRTVSDAVHLRSWDHDVELCFDCVREAANQASIA